ncbi:hypothetical protein P4S95_17460 [Aneurinibacillus aneurinilyticus]|uniref:hypothetical protein n=1 Tax=Aneurinibacillus aneurinilyticus TaxID=1391 RepID=UPI002E22A54F|nr:hypothetical protein [Aneurinibacillus aneurinilyticus]
MIIHKVEERRCTRRRVPSSFSHKEEARPLCGAKAGPQGAFNLLFFPKFPLPATRPCPNIKYNFHRTILPPMILLK